MVEKLSISLPFFASTLANSTNEKVSTELRVLTSLKLAKKQFQVLKEQLVLILMEIGIKNSHWVS